MNEINTNTHSLKMLWAKMLATPPADDQFGLWAEMHTNEVIREAILKTAAKNMSLGKTMDQNYKVRFASKVMLAQSERNASNAKNRELLHEQMTRRVL
jgi:hypothetical protein